MMNNKRKAHYEEHFRVADEEEEVEAAGLAIQQERFWLEFWLEKSLEFWLEISYTKKIGKTGNCSAQCKKVMSKGGIKEYEGCNCRFQLTRMKQSATKCSVQFCSC